MSVDATAINAQVTGFMTPIYDRTDPVTGETLHGLARSDFDRVVAGYACPACLAKFTSYRFQCPLCGWQRDLAADIKQAPDFWQQSIDERENDRTPYAKAVKNPFDQMMAGLASDRDVDHVALSDLARKSKVRRD